MTLTRRQIVSAVVLAFAASATAQLHQGDVLLRVNDGRVQTGAATAAGGPVFPVRVYVSTFGDSGIADRTTNPGFQALSGDFPGGADVGLRITAALRKWNGDDFLTIPPEFMTIRKDAFTITTPTADPTPPDSGPTLAVGLSDPSSGEFHEHPGYRLLSPASDGLYLLAGEVFVNIPEIAPSESFYVVFRQNFDDTIELEQALEWIEANLLGTACPSDWNDDGVVNSTDVSDFINDWFVDQVDGTLVTDFNSDGVSNSTDVSDFINAWFESVALGC